MKLLLFLIKFIIIFSILGFILSIIDLSFLNNFIAFVSSSFLGLNFFENTVFVGTQTFVVTNYCTGFMSAIILASIIFALRRPNLFKKFKIFLFGALLLLVINVPRVMLVLLFARAWIGIDIELIHSITWFVMSAIILVIWYYVSRIVSKEKDISNLL